MAQVRVGESPIRARRRRRRTVLTLAIVGALVVALGGLVWLMNADFLRIQTIAVEGGRTVAKEVLEARVEEQLAGAYFFLFPKNNIFLYPKEKIISELLADYSTLASVAVQAENFNRIAVRTEDRSPRALWCGETPAVPTPCVLLDEGGVAYGEAPDFSEDPYVRYYGEVAQGELPQQYLTEDTFSSLAALVEAISQDQKEYGIRSVFVDAAGDAHVLFEGDFVLLFAVTGDGADIFERFTLALSSEPFEGRSLQDFEYLDLRFGDRLYYKLKNQ